MADFDGFVSDLQNIINKHSIDSWYGVPDHILTKRICDFLASDADDETDGAQTLTEAYNLENEVATQEDTVPQLYVGSELKINDVSFVVTDFHNSFDRAATGSIMSIDDIRQTASNPAAQVSRRMNRPYRNARPYMPERVYADNVPGSYSDEPIRPANL